MTDHPSTFGGVPTGSGGMDWDARASIHRRDDGGGVFDAMKEVNRGSLAEMVALVCAMPESQRAHYVIQKAGDRRLGLGEIIALAKRDDFPG
jgi:hypothetical protein